MSWQSWLSDLSAVDVTEPLAAHLAGNTLVAYGILGATTLPPLVPNSAILVTGGVLAAQGRLNIVAVLAVVALSALLGDMLIHRGGAAMNQGVVRRVYRRPRRRALMEWTAQRMDRHGVPFVIACRFLPSGRLFGGLTAGVVRFPTRRYLLGVLIAEMVWASYSVGLGYFGGQATSSSMSAVVLGIGVSSLVAAVGAVAQWAARRGDRHPRGPVPGTSPPGHTPPASRGGEPLPAAGAAPDAPQAPEASGAGPARTSPQTVPPDTGGSPGSPSSATGSATPDRVQLPRPPGPHAVAPRTGTCPGAGIGSGAAGHPPREAAVGCARTRTRCTGRFPSYLR
ncbi:DedA family protein [Wenjunlia vitaminophila]|uniref:DedA family protein n=1 Tax=Wenjunlia vitaminophila TaxID=76728 RepID=UPI00039A253F|nr:DedA family protein [Wenjunlia vitaminophila]